MWRLQQALGLSRKEFINTHFDIVEQFAIAKGEEVVLNRYNQAEATATGISASLNSEDILGNYRTDLISLVAKPKPLTKEDILTLNEKAAQRLKNTQ